VPLAVTADKARKDGSLEAADTLMNAAWQHRIGLSETDFAISPGRSGEGIG